MKLVARKIAKELFWRIQYQAVGFIAWVVARLVPRRQAHDPGDAPVRRPS